MSGTRRKAGQLAPEVEGYGAWLVERGYTPSTIRNMLKDLGQVGLWLSSQGLTAADLDEERVAAFLAARHAAGRRRIPGTRAMAPLLDYLRATGTAAEAQPLVTPLTALVAQYRCWLVTERGLAPSTVLR